MADLIKSKSHDKKSLENAIEQDGPAEAGDMELLGSSIPSRLLSLGPLNRRRRD